MTEDRDEKIARAIEAVISEMEPIINPETDLRALMRLANENSAAKGFHDYGRLLRAKLENADAAASARPRDQVAQAEYEFLEASAQRYIGNMLMLIAGEVAEAHEEVRTGRSVTETYFESDDSGNLKPLGFPSEIADIAIRLFDLAAEFSIDLPGIIAMKMAYNASRSRMHGGKVM